MKKTIDDLTKLKNAKRKIEYALFEKKKERILELIDNRGLDDGATLKEIAIYMNNKPYASSDDIKEAYYIIDKHIRKSTNRCFGYSNKKYGWCKTEEEIVNYRLKGAGNGLAKAKSNFNKLPINFKAEGITSNPYPLFIEKARDFGFFLLNHDKKSKEGENNI